MLSMKKVSRARAVKDADELFEHVERSGNYVLIARGGKPAVAVVPASQVERLRRGAVERLRDFFRAEPDASMSDEEAMAMVLDEIKADRKARRRRAARK